MIALSILLSGCSLLPEIRVGQAKVPSVPEEHPMKAEGERQAGEYLATTVVDEPQRDVAVALSTSLGVPKATVIEPDKIVTNLRKGQIRDREVQQKFEDKIEKYAGKDIEDTGWNITGSLGGLGMIAIIAACIFIPGFGSLMLFVFRRLRNTTKQLVSGISNFETADPEGAAKLKDYLSKNMDRSQKLLIRKLK
jgi:hypothetical protein